MRPLLILFVLALVGCAQPTVTLLGNDPGTAAPLSVHGALSQKANSSVVVRGTLIEKCPTAGCWFRLKDDTGVVRVDLKETGFTVTDVPLGTTITVLGKVQRETGDTQLNALGLRY